MENSVRAITWEAPEHHHVDKQSDWFVALGILVFAFTLTAAIFGDVLFAILLIVGGMVLALSAAKKPRIIPFSISVRGVRIDDQLLPFTTLRSYHIDEEDPRGPHLLILSQRRFTPMYVIPLPPDHIDDVEEIMQGRLAEEHLQEPLLLKALEFFGF